ncbi:endo-beta-N-acetylglucosaminidase H [Sinomicrobium sp. M5D2P17]
MKTQITLLWSMVAFALFTSCEKESDLPENELKAENATAVVKNGPLSVMYVEVNGSNILNAGSYSLEDSGAPFFDIAIIFAANINYDVASQRAVFHANENVQAVLDGRDTFVQPLQDRGIKVLLSILGNHQGAGIANFPDRAAARDFAEQLADVVYTYDLDGIDFDDEYAKYGENGTGQPNSSSFIMLLQELRDLMPDKIISFYYYGPTTAYLEWNGNQAGEYLDYSWNAMYSTYSAPNVPGLTKEEESAAAIHINQTSSSTANNFATSTINDGYGLYLMYDMRQSDYTSYLSGISGLLYGEATELTGQLYPWPMNTPVESKVSLYKHCDYNEEVALLDEGAYTLPQLIDAGVTNDDISSLKVPSGFTVTIYEHDNFGGNSVEVTSDISCLTQINFNDEISSLVISEN